MRVFLYARVSTDDKEQTPESQLMKCREYAHIHNHKILGEYADIGVSGDSLIWDRPAGKNAKASFIDSNKVDGIIVFSVDRYSRESPIKVLQQIAHLKERGIKFISITEPPFNMDSEFAEPLQYMLTWFSNWFLVQHKKKVRAGMDRAKTKGTRSGKPIGRPKLSGWYKNRIREYHAQGVSMKKIAKELGLSVGVVHKTLHNLAEEKNPPKSEHSQTNSFMNGGAKGYE